MDNRYFHKNKQKMEENTKGIEYLTLTIGWVLGLFSTLIVEFFKNLFLRNKIKNLILNELKELQLDLLILCLSTTAETEPITQEWANWFRKYFHLIISLVKDTYKLPDNLKSVDFSKLDESQFLNAVLLISRGFQAKENVTSSMLKLSLNYTESKIDLIYLFKTEFQAQIRKILNRLGVINMIIEQTWFYHTKTYESLSKENHYLSKTNIKNNTRKISTRTKSLIDYIQLVIEKETTKDD